MANRVVKDFKLVTKAAPTSNQTMEECALFTDAGVPVTVLTNSNVAAAQTDAAAATSSAAVAAPTKAEYDALRTDYLELRTVVNSLLAKMRTAGLLAP